MKKKLRDITVDGVDYLWSLRYYAYEGYCLRVWNGKRLLFREHSSQWPRDTVFNGMITPALVADRIKTFFGSVTSQGLDRL